MIDANNHPEGLGDAFFRHAFNMDHPPLMKSVVVQQYMRDEQYHKSHYLRRSVQIETGG